MAKRNLKTAAQLNENRQTHKDGTIEWWRDVPKYQKLYRVSDSGRVKSVDKMCQGRSGGMRLVKGRILKLGIESLGHLHVTLCKPGEKQRTFKNAVLVLMAFNRMPRPDEVARHWKDPDPTNNNLWNLKWGTRTNNAQDDVRHKGKYHASKLTPKQVEKILYLLEKGEMQQKDIATKFKVSGATITLIKQGKSQTLVADKKRVKDLKAQGDGRKYSGIAGPNKRIK